MSDVGENDRGVVDEAACGDGAGVGILDGSVNASSGHAGRARLWNILRFFGSRLRGLLAESKLSEDHNTEKQKSEERQRQRVAWHKAGVHFVAAPDTGSSI